MEASRVRGREELRMEEGFCKAKLMQMLFCVRISGCGDEMLSFEDKPPSLTLNHHIYLNIFVTVSASIVIFTVDK